ncbi:MAG: hypothetical protein ACJ788_03245 [Ktedonobacteraceae bacterium]
MQSRNRFRELLDLRTELVHEPFSFLYGGITGEDVHMAYPAERSLLHDVLLARSSPMVTGHRHRGVLSDMTR